MTSIIVMAAVLIIPLIIGSMFVCVPKWWTQSVEPHLPNWLTKDRPMSKAAEGRWAMVAKILLLPTFFIFVLMLWLIRGWFVIGLAAIEGACPYNGNFKWRECLSKWFDGGKVPLKDLSAEDVFGDN